MGNTHKTEDRYLFPTIEEKERLKETVKQIVKEVKQKTESEVKHWNCLMGKKRMIKMFPNMKDKK